MPFYFFTDNFYLANYKNKIRFIKYLLFKNLVLISF